MKEECTEEIFLGNVKNHEMAVDYDNGINRRVVFKIPDSNEYCFSLVTFPDHLVIAGHMGTYVFKHCPDMFSFFNSQKISQYWEEKLVAADWAKPAKKFSQEAFNKAIMDQFEEFCAEENPPENDVRKIKEELRYILNPETEAQGIDAAGAFSCLGFEVYSIDDYNFKEHTYHFTWCLHAIRWGVGEYYAEKEATE